MPNPPTDHILIVAELFMTEFQTMIIRIRWQSLSPQSTDQMCTPIVIYLSDNQILIQFDQCSALQQIRFPNSDSAGSGLTPKQGSEVVEVRPTIISSPLNPTLFSSDPFSTQFPSVII